MKDESKKPKKILDSEIPKIWALDVQHRSWERMRDNDGWKSEYVSKAISSRIEKRYIVEHAMKIATECLIEIFHNGGKIESSYDTGLMLTDKKGKQYAVDITIRELS